MGLVSTGSAEVRSHGRCKGSKHPGGVATRVQEKRQMAFVSVWCRVAAVLALALAALPAAALDCPVAQPNAAPGVIRETPAQIDRLANLLGSGDAANRVPDIVRDLRQRYPAAGSAEIVNFLVTAYCPVVNLASGLGDAEKQARLMAFSSSVFSIAGP